MSLDSAYGFGTTFSLTDKMSTGLRSIGDRFHNLRETMDRESKTIDKIQNRMATGFKVFGAGVAVLAGIGLAASPFSEFEAGMTKALNNMPDLTQNASLALENLARDAVRSGFSVQEATSAMFNALSSGLVSTENAARDAQMFYGTVMRAAISEGASMDTVMTALSKTMKGFGIPIDKAAETMDKMVLAARMGELELENLASGLPQLAGFANLSGVKLEEMLAAISVVTDGSRSAEQAIAGLTQLIASIDKPTKEASDLAESLGINLSLTGLRSKGLAGWLGELLKKTNGNAEAMIKLIGPIEGVRALMPLATTQTKRFYEQTALLGDATGTVQQGLEKVNKTFAQQWREIKGTVVDIGIEIGKVFKPYMQPLVEGLTTVLEKFRALSPEVKDGLAQLTLLGVGALFVTGGLITLSAAAGYLSIAFKGLGVSAMVGMGWIGLIAAAVVGAIYLFFKFRKEIGAVFGKAFDAAKQFAPNWTRFIDMLAGVGTALKGVGMSVLSLFGGVLDILGGFWPVLKPILGMILVIFGGVGVALLFGFGVALSVIADTLMKVGQFLSAIGESIKFVIEWLGKLAGFDFAPDFSKASSAWSSLFSFDNTTSGAFIDRVNGKLPADNSTEGQGPPSLGTSLGKYSNLSGVPTTEEDQSAGYAIDALASNRSNERLELLAQPKAIAPMTPIDGSDRTIDLKNDINLSLEAKVDEGVLMRLMQKYEKQNRIRKEQ